MSATQEPGHDDFPVTCPQCQFDFVPSAAPAVPAARPSGTVSMGPPLERPATPTTPLQMPERIARFAIRRFLGEGSFGRVYEAYDPTLKRVVALKVAKPEQMGGPKQVERFSREARAAANLMHPNVVAVFDSGGEGGLHYIASAFVPGRALDVVLDERRLELREAVEVVRKLAEALAYAHREGVVHRDVKPGNVMLREDGEPMLMDFGLAARLDETEKLTVAGQFMGTPEYCAPEQWRGQATAASDQYALGCVLYETLTGQKPFAGADPAHYLMLHTTQPAPSPRQFAPSLPRDLETVTLKCLEKEQGRRYADCGALAEDLRRWLAGEPVAARRPGVGEQVVRWARRNPVTLLAALALVLAMSVVVAGVLARLASKEAELARRGEKQADEARQLASDEKMRADGERDVAQKEQARADGERDVARQERTRADGERERADANAMEANKQRDRADLLVYVGQLALAQEAWERNDGARALELVNGCRWDLRGWEHRHLWTLFNSNQQTFRGHTREVTSVAFSPDGKRILTGSYDNTAKVWDAQKGTEVLSLKGHTSIVWSVAFSPDGKRILTGSQDKTAKVWDAQKGQEVLTLKGHTNWVMSAAFSPDGTRILTGSNDGTAKVWDAEKGQEVLSLEGHTGYVLSVAFSPDGKRILTGSGDSTAKVWDAQKGQEVLSLEGHTSIVWSVAFSPDGKRILTGSSDKTAKVWDAQKGTEVLSLEGHTDYVWSVAFSPDGKRILTGSSDKTAKVWDAEKGQEVLSLKGHTGFVMSVAFSPDGKRILTGSWDQTAKVWDAQKGKEVLSLKGHTGSVESVAFSPDGKRIFARGEDGKILAWDATSGQRLDDAPKVMPERAGEQSIRGDLRASADGNTVRVERILSPDEERRRQYENSREYVFRHCRPDREFHADEAARAEKDDPFACVFHLGRLLVLTPGDRPALLKRRANVLSAALKADANDHWAARSLARQAVADPTTVPDAKTLLASLSRQPHAPLDRLHGALLLHTGNARAAAVVLRAAVRHRPPDTPPIDELLLSLALIELDRRDEARQHLKTAAAWMDNGTAPQRLASLLGARPAGPLASLAAVAHVPDVRLNSLDPFTAHELYTLRREAERKLAGR